MQRQTLFAKVRPVLEEPYILLHLLCHLVKAECVPILSQVLVAIARDCFAFPE